MEGNLTSSNSKSDELEVEPLPIHVAPVIVVTLGAVFIIISMFLPYLASNDVGNITHNSGFESDPVIILGAIGGGIAAIRYFKTGSRKAANSTIFVGLWFLGWTIFNAYNSQLHRIGCDTCLLDTSASVGLYAMGMGSAIVALGGLMMRFPTSTFGLASGSVSTQEEDARRTSVTKVCPRCAETIKAAAKVCRYCQANLESDPVA